MNWFKDNVGGIFVLAIFAAVVAQILWGLAGVLWRKINWGKRIVDFLATIMRPFALSRLLAHRYLQTKDYFRFISLTATTMVGFVVSSIVFFTVLVLAVIFFIVYGVHVSWALFVLFSVLVFFFLGWLKDGLYFYGVFEQTIKKDHDRFREILRTLDSSILHAVTQKDLDVLLAPKEKKIEAATVEQPAKERPQKTSES